VIQIDVLHGTKAGTQWVARRFPFGIGREKHAALSLTDDGVWEAHAVLTVRPGDGCYLAARPEPVSVVNGHRVTEPVRLANGDIIDLGSARLRFGLAPTQLSSMAWRETLVWCALVLLFLGQIALIYFVLP
jgi:pSer/pThr/pTyr-binding forkhead associated (FHA) protein